MSFALPPVPPRTEISVRPLGNSRDQTSPLTGASQRIVRPGGKHALSLSLPAITHRAAREWIAARRRAEDELVTFPVPVLEAAASPIGAAVAVDGAGQLGKSLAVRGLFPHAVVSEGRPVSLASGGRLWLHYLTADVAADAAGKAVLQLAPMLRVTPADGDPVELEVPLIEGLLSTEDAGWTARRLSVAGLNAEIIELR